MNILIEHHGILPVVKYGGTERIIYWLMKELVRLKHRVYLVGHPQSKVQDIGVELIPHQSGDSDWRKLIPSDTDIIHLFYQPSFEFDRPLLVTIEGNGKAGENFGVNTVFVSQKHAKNHGAQAFVYNGLDLSEYPWGPEYEGLNKRQDFMFLAKASWKVKNLKDSVWACKKSKQHLHIAGGRSWWPSRYIHSYGMIDLEKKEEIFKKCKALLFPVRWHEPFGIAVIEAQARGLLVAASPYGSLPELVQNGMGRICYNKNDLFNFVNSSLTSNFLGPKDIRVYIEKNFSSKAMAQAYLTCYERILSGEKLNEIPPAWNLPQAAQELLPF